MAIKPYTVKKTINGTEYTAQFAGLSVALRGVDSSYIDNSSQVSVEKMSKYIFEHVIVEPKGLTADDFSSFEEFNEVVKFGQDVMQGKEESFRNATDESPSKEKGKK